MIADWRGREVILLSVRAVNNCDTCMSVYKIVVLRDEWALLIPIERRDSVHN